MKKETENQEPVLNSAMLGSDTCSICGQYMMVKVQHPMCGYGDIESATANCNTGNEVICPYGLPSKSSSVNT